MSTLEAPLLAVKDGMVTFGGPPLFSNITFGIHPRDRICLLGRNGAGKTTLMKVVTGERELDLGERTFQPGTKIGYLPQQPEEYTEGNVRDYVLSGLPPEERGAEQSYRADMVLGPLGLDADRQLAGLSGGQMRRAALARALVAQPDILLLDEPTNHLDLPTIFWLEEYLGRYPGALLLISHDRRFLANVTGKVFWMDRGTMRVLGKGYAEFDDWAENILNAEEAELRRLGKKLEEEEVWRQQGVTARRTRNMRRMGELHRLRDKLRAEKAHRRRAEAKITLEESETIFYSKMVAEFRNVSLSFGDTKIFEGFSTKIQRGDRIGILGPNGSGKTTLVELLTGNIQPTGGNIRRAVNLNISYFDQRRRALDPKQTLWQTLCPQGGDRVQVGAKSRHVMGYLKDFLFDPKQAQSPVNSLSGGEANRLLLAKVLAKPGDILILDEPTNDLDMDSLDVLEDFLGEYPGTLVLVSHDRDFLDRTVTRLLAFEEGGHIEEVVGGYTDYERQKAASKNPPPKGGGQGGGKAGNAPVLQTTPKPSNEKSARMSYKDKRELEMLPEKIATLEARIAEYGQALADPGLYMRDPAGFDEASRGLEKARKEKDHAETRWLELEALREQSSA